MRLNSAKDLEVYKKAYDLAMQIFILSKKFPGRRTRDCGFISVEQHRELVLMCQEVGRMLGSMIKTPSAFLISDV
jgi:hypothetical protein